MNCNYKVKITDIQTKYKFKVFCTGYDDSDLKQKIDTMYEAWPKATAEGETPTLDNTANATMSIDLKGNTSQDGTPTPDDPVDVHVVTGDNEITIINKNLFHDYTDTYSMRGITITKGENELTLNGTYDKLYNGDFWLTKSINGTSYNDNIILLKANTTYTFKLYFVEGTMTGTPNCVLSSRTVSDKTFSWNYRTIVKGTNGYQDTWTPTEDIYLAAIRFPVQPAMNVVFDNLKVVIQVEKGSEATDYTPYQSQSYAVNLGSMELCKIGDYQDYIYKDNKKWYKYGAIGKVVLNGSENWTKSSLSGINRYYIPGSFINTILNPNTIDLMSDHFICITPNQSDQKNNGLSKLNNTSIMINFDLTDADFDTVAKFKTWLTSNNTTLYYVLATPTTTEITDTTLISQLNALAGAESYSGQTNISQTNDDKPFILTAKALKDLSNL